MNVEEIAKIGKRLRVNYPNKKKEEVVEILNDWENMLSKLDYNIVNQNLDEHLMSSPYFPKITELSKNHSMKVKSTIPGIEETQSYIDYLKSLENEAASKEVAMKYIEQMKKGLLFND